MNFLKKSIFIAIGSSAVIIAAVVGSYYLKKRENKSLEQEMEDEEDERHEELIDENFADEILNSFKKAKEEMKYSENIETVEEIEKFINWIEKNKTEEEIKKAFYQDSTLKWLKTFSILLNKVGEKTEDFRGTLLKINTNSLNKLS